MLQLSELPPSTCEALTVTVPVTSNWTVIFWHTAIGFVVSSTVTVAVQLLVLPPTSVTVRVTVFAPISAHVKLLGLTLKEAIPQLSELPLSIWEAVIVALLEASNWIVMSWQTATGAWASVKPTV